MPGLARVSCFHDISPNLITLIAAMFLVIPHLYTWVKYGSGFEGKFEEYDSLLVGVCMMIYIVSDFNFEDFR